MSKFWDWGLGIPHLNFLLLFFIGSLPGHFSYLHKGVLVRFWFFLKQIHHTSLGCVLQSYPDISFSFGMWDVCGKLKLYLVWGVRRSL